jgi:hypothetical protein
MMLGFEPSPATMTPEFGNALIAIDAIVLVLFVVIVYSAKIAAGSSRIFKMLSASLLAERFRLWRAAHKGR